MLVARVLLSALLLEAPLVVLAQEQPAAAGSTVVVRGKKNADPNRQICRTSESTGSRLQRKRECRTASEWAEQQALDRQNIERQQAMRWKSE